MSNDKGTKEQPPDIHAGVKRRGLFRIGTAISAFTGTAAISVFSANTAQAGPGDKNPPTTYVPIAEKGVATGVATLDVEAKIPPSQLPDLSAKYGPKAEQMVKTFAAKSALALNVTDFGARGDYRTAADASITGNQLTVPSYAFGGADVGKFVTVYNNSTGIGLNSNHLNGTITDVNAGVATLSVSSASPRRDVRADWASNDRAAIQAAIDAAMATDDASGDGLAREVMFDPNVTTWWIDGPLVIGTSASPSMPVTLRGGSTAGAQFAGTFLKDRSLLGSTTIQKTSSKAGHDIIQHYGHGLTLERVCLDGRMAAGYLLNVSYSFELRIKECRFMRCYTTAIKLQTTNNGILEDIHVNYCGNGRAWPAVKFSSTRNADDSLSPTNTVQITNMHVEFNSGVDIDVASGQKSDDYAEFLTFVNLHSEATISPWYNLLSPVPETAKNVPSVVLGNARSIQFVNAVMYAKSAPALEIRSQYSVPGVEYGAGFANCVFLGISGVDRVVDILEMQKGTVSFTGCKFMGSEKEFIRVDAGFTGLLSRSGNVYGENIVPVPAAGRIVDNRAITSPTVFENVLTDRDIGTTGTGHFVSRTPATHQRPTIAAGAGMGSGMAPPTISGSDSQGQITFNTGATPVADSVILTVTFRKPFSPGAGRVFLTPGNKATAQLGLPYVGMSGTSWSLYYSTAPSGSLTNLSYSYFVVGSAI